MRAPDTADGVTSPQPGWLSRWGSIWPKPTTALPPVQRPPHRILLAEDGWLNQKIAETILTQHGYTVVVAHNGHDVLTAVQHEAFDLILMDVHMPGMDGVETAAAIRAQEQVTGGHIPILAMTESAMDDDRARCLDAGMDGYIAKPVHAADLYQAVEEMIRSAPGPQLSTGASRADLEATPVLDWEAALEQLDGNAALLQNLIGVFYIEAPKLMTDIQQAIAQEDTLALQRAAHTLKGSATIFAAQPVAAAALRLEVMGRDETLTDAASAWSALQDAMAQLLPALRALAKVDER